MLELGYGAPCHYKHQLNGTKQKRKKNREAYELKLLEAIRFLGHKSSEDIT